MSSRRRLPRKRSSGTSPNAPLWIAARARNALRRPLLIGGVGVVAFLASVLALAILPQQARKAAAALRPTTVVRPDTEPTSAALHDAERRAATADSVLVQTRAELGQIAAATAAAAAAAADTTTASKALTGPTAGQRDTLSSQIALLGRLIVRSQNAPLLGSYRALAQAPPMQGDPRVKLLLDSLVEIERERDSYNAVGGVDPVFVALTARANELGRNIESLAGAKRSALRAQLGTLSPAPAPAAVASKTPPDTTAALHARDAARVSAAAFAATLQRDRATLVQLDEREERARELSNVGASPAAILAAAFVFAAALGFGVALFQEVRSPRIADAFEAQRATGIRVLAEIRPLPAPTNPDRRTVDRTGARYIDPGADGHQLIYLTIATAGVNTVMLTVTGDSPAVTSVVAINFAAIAADEARSTLLIDTDGLTSSVTAALRLRTSAGMSGLVAGTQSWPEVTRTARLGRDRTIDMVPAGDAGVPVEKISDVLKRDATTLTRHYDAIVIASSAAQAVAGLPAALPIPDVIYCVRAGQTSVATLKLAVHQITESGARVRGLVLWNAADPVLAELRPVEEVDGEHSALEPQNI
jgi:Mrp family chromosome partitioning ATPase